MEQQVTTESELILSAASTVAKLFEATAVRIGKAMSGAARDRAIAVLGSLQGYQSYLSETFDRVSTIKTFANPTLPVDLLDHFVTMELVSKGANKNVINQDDLIRKIRRASRIVVSATAGYGKSMLMRYIALSLYESPMGVIPLFIELRDLNRFKSPNILAYIHAAYKKHSKIGEESLKQGLENGLFVLLLDGFDELNHEHRAGIESQILELAKNYEKTSVIVSGRPDDKFLSWRRFEVLKVCPMTKSRVIELIGKLDYDSGTKRRFIAKIKGGLFETHESFLSTPLLAILMLLTYEENANIPDRMHLFYGKAFETLFHKHDALKEQYDRQRRSNLQIDEFGKVFSVFCLNTYVLERLEFNQSEILRFLRAALEYSQAETQPQNMLFDLEEAVCLLQKEGTSYFFVHRSFQEYFTALFLSSCPTEIRDNFIDEVSMRHWDNVLPMLFDMAADQIEPTWVSDNLDKYLDFVDQTDNCGFNGLLARWVGMVTYHDGQSEEFSHFIPGPFSKVMSVARRFYPDIFEHTQSLNFSVSELGRKMASIEDAKVGHVPDTKPGEPKVRKYSFTHDHEALLRESGLFNFIDSEISTVRKIREQIDKQQKARNIFLNKLFTAAQE